MNQLLFRAIILVSIIEISCDENRLSEKMCTFVYCSLLIVINTKLQLLVRRVNSNLPAYFF